MKKYIISAAVAVALIVAGGYGVKSSLNPQLHLSDLAKANVEALAGDESPGDGTWIRSDLDCKWSFRGRANVYVTINVFGAPIRIRTNADGFAEFTAHYARVHCDGGGNSQCTATNCPFAFWSE